MKNRTRINASSLWTSYRRLPILEVTIAQLRRADPQLRKNAAPKTISLLQRGSMLVLRPLGVRGSVASHAPLSRLRAGGLKT
ncbi:MAG: hypothetical protein D6695_09590 [Planctomycetota bacterium]|nr:MAG: hypothetical protein D6695_09590 [Planctomycetota bacterium]